MLRLEIDLQLAGFPGSSSNFLIRSVIWATLNLDENDSSLKLRLASRALIQQRASLHLFKRVVEMSRGEDFPCIEESSFHGTSLVYFRQIVEWRPNKLTVLPERVWLHSVKLHANGCLYLLKKDAIAWSSQSLHSECCLVHLWIGVEDVVPLSPWVGRAVFNCVLKCNLWEVGLATLTGIRLDVLHVLFVSIDAPLFVYRALSLLSQKAVDV